MLLVNKRRVRHASYSALSIYVEDIVLSAGQEKPMRSIITFTIALLWACACSASDPVQTLTHCDDLSGWSSRAQLSTDAQEGRFAIVAFLLADQTGFVTYDFFSTGQDISKKHSLSFWWKAEGNSLRDLKIKVRNYPLVGGWEAIYTIWSGQTPPQGWQLAVVELAKPQYDNWGGQPDYNQRYIITFRAETSSKFKCASVHRSYC